MDGIISFLFGIAIGLLSGLFMSKPVEEQVPVEEATCDRCGKKCTQYLRCSINSEVSISGRTIHYHSNDAALCEPCGTDIFFGDGSNKVCTSQLASILESK